MSYEWNYEDYLNNQIKEIEELKKKRIYEARNA